MMMVMVSEEDRSRAYCAPPTSSRRQCVQESAQVQRRRGAEAQRRSAEARSHRGMGPWAHAMAQLPAPTRAARPPPAPSLRAISPKWAR